MFQTVSKVSKYEVDYITVQARAKGLRGQELEQVVANTILDLYAKRTSVIRPKKILPKHRDYDKIIRRGYYRSGSARDRLLIGTDSTYNPSETREYRRPDLQYAERVEELYKLSKAQLIQLLINCQDSLQALSQ